MVFIYLFIILIDNLINKSNLNVRYVDGVAVPYVPLKERLFGFLNNFYYLL